MKLTFLIADNCLASGIVSLLDTLTIANLWQQKLTSNYKQLFTTELVSLDGGVVNTGGGVQLVAAKALAETGGTEYIVIPPFLPVGSWEANTKKELTSWLRAKHRAGVPIAALCTGSFLLAETGLLDGRPATTNWQFARRFQRYYPKVNLRPEEIMTEDEGLICTGAATAYFNFALTLIERYGSRALARCCAKALLIDPNRTSQAPYCLDLEKKGHKDAAILKAQQFMEENYASIIAVDQVAVHVGISSRHFKRRFKKATGRTPLTYLQNLRIDQAKKKLESTIDSIEEITRHIGYENSSTFRRLFRQRVSLSPREYRDKFAQR